jgi:hypothetical protein
MEVDELRTVTVKAGCDPLLGRPRRISPHAA